MVTHWMLWIESRCRNYLIMEALTKRVVGKSGY